MEGFSNHSSEWKQEMGCSEVAMRYFSSSAGEVVEGGVVVVEEVEVEGEPTTL